VGCWHGYLSGARHRLAYGAADATATHCLLLHCLGTFWYRLIRVVLDKGPLGCVCVCVCVTKSSPSFCCTLALNPAFSVAPIESPRYGSPSLWRTIIENIIAQYHHHQHSNSVKGSFPCKTKQPDSALLSAFSACSGRKPLV